MHASWSRLCASVRAAYWGATPFQTRARLSQHSDLRENEPIPVHFRESIEMFAGRRLDECHVERQAYRAKFTPRTERAWSGNVIRKIKHLLCKLSHQPLPRVSQCERETPIVHNLNMASQKLLDKTQSAHSGSLLQQSRIWSRVARTHSHMISFTYAVLERTTPSLYPPKTRASCSPKPPAGKRGQVCTWFTTFPLLARWKRDFKEACHSDVGRAPLVSDRRL